MIYKPMKYNKKIKFLDKRINCLRTFEKETSKKHIKGRSQNKELSKKSKQILQRLNYKLKNGK